MHTHSISYFIYFFCLFVCFCPFVKPNSHITNRWDIFYKIFAFSFYRIWFNERQKKITWLVYAFNLIFIAYVKAIECWNPFTCNPWSVHLFIHAKKLTISYLFKYIKIVKVFFFCVLKNEKIQDEEHEILRTWNPH